MLDSNLPKVQEAHLPGAFLPSCALCANFSRLKSYPRPLPRPTPPASTPPSPPPRQQRRWQRNWWAPAPRPRQPAPVPGEGGEAGELWAPPHQPLSPCTASGAAPAAAALLECRLGLTPRAPESKTRRKHGKQERDPLDSGEGENGWGDPTVWAGVFVRPRR